MPVCSTAFSKALLLTFSFPHILNSTITSHLNPSLSSLFSSETPVVCFYISILPGNGVIWSSGWKSTSKLKWEMRCTFLTGRAINHQNSIPRGAVESAAHGWLAVFPRDICFSSATSCRDWCWSHWVKFSGLSYAGGQTWWSEWSLQAYALCVTYFFFLHHIQAHLVPHLQRFPELSSCLHPSSHLLLCPSYTLCSASSFSCFLILMTQGFGFFCLSLSEHQETLLFSFKSFSQLPFSGSYSSHLFAPLSNWKHRVGLEVITLIRAWPRHHGYTFWFPVLFPFPNRIEWLLFVIYWFSDIHPLHWKQCPLVSV